MEEKIMFKEICKIVKRRIFSVIGATVVFAAALIALFALLFNPMRAQYSLRFTLAYPDWETFKFADGSPFYFEDIVSLESLRAVKESDGLFSKINVDKMAEKDDVSIASEQFEDGRMRYTLSAKVSYFKDCSAATAFLRAAAERPLEIAGSKAAAIGFGLDEDVFRAAPLSERIELLVAQRESILAQYDAWIGLYSANYPVAGKTLQNHRAEVAVLFGTALQEQFAEELERNGYVPEEQLSARIAALQAERVSNEKKIAALQKQLSSASPSSSAGEEGAGLSGMIAQLIVRNIEIDDMLEVLTVQNVQAFERRLSEQYTKLQSAATTARAVSTALYEQESRVNFETARAAEDGDVSLIVVGVCGAILGFLLSSAAVCAAEFSRRKQKAGTDEPAQADEPVETDEVAERDAGTDGEV